MGGRLDSERVIDFLRFMITVVVAVVVELVLRALTRRNQTYINFVQVRFDAFHALGTLHVKTSAAGLLDLRLAIHRRLGSRRRGILVPHSLDVCHTTDGFLVLVVDAKVVEIVFSAILRLNHAVVNLVHMVSKTHHALRATEKIHIRTT